MTDTPAPMNNTTSGARANAATDRLAPKRIAIIAEHYAPFAGGNEQSTSQIAVELARRGHEVTLIVASSPDEASIDNVTIQAMTHRHLRHAHQLLQFTRFAQRALDAGNFDLSLATTSLVAADIVQPRGGTIVETQQRNIAMRGTSGARITKGLAFALNPKQQLMRKLESQVVQSSKVKRFAAVSDYVRRQLIEHHDVPKDRIAVIFNAAEMPSVDASVIADWRQKIRETYAIPDEATAFLFAAQNPRLKGFEPLVQAWQRVAEKQSAAVLMLAGNYGYGHAMWLGRLGLRDSIRMIGPTTQMPALYAACDVTVLPSFYDPASKVVLEALSMDRPAITTRYNGSADALVAPDGAMRGRVIEDPADHAGLARAMIELCDPDQRDACRAAMSGLATELSMVRHVDELEQLMRQIINEGQAADTSDARTRSHE